MKVRTWSTFPSSLDFAIGTIDPNGSKPICSSLGMKKKNQSIRDFPSAHRTGVRDPPTSASNLTQGQTNGCANRWQKKQNEIVQSSNLAHAAQSQQNPSDLALVLDLKVDHTIT